MVKPKKFIFVLMPFLDGFKDIYHLGIKETCKQLNCYCERVDEQEFDGSILERIYNQISKADIIIADMTGKNPNVFYEVGYAHALGKKVISLTQNLDDIPFDLKHYPHIIDGNSIIDLKDKLNKKLDFFLNEKNQALIEALYSFNVEVYFDGNKIEEGAELKIDGKYYRGFGAIGKFDFKNNSDLLLKEKFFLGIESNTDISKFIIGFQIVKQSDDKILMVSEEIETIYPHAWKSIEFGLPNFTMPEDIFSFDARLILYTSHQNYSWNVKFLFEKDKQPQSVWQDY